MKKNKTVRWTEKEENKVIARFSAIVDANDKVLELPGYLVISQAQEVLAKSRRRVLRKDQDLKNSFQKKMLEVCFKYREAINAVKPAPASTETSAKIQDDLAAEVMKIISPQIDYTLMTWADNVHDSSNNAIAKVLAANTEMKANCTSTLDYCTTQANNLVDRLTGMITSHNEEITVRLAKHKQEIEDLVLNLLEKPTDITTTVAVTTTARIKNPVHIYPRKFKVAVYYMLAYRFWYERIKSEIPFDLQNKIEWWIPNVHTSVCAHKHYWPKDFVCWCYCPTYSRDSILSGYVARDRRNQMVDENIVQFYEPASAESIAALITKRARAFFAAQPK